MVASSDDGEEVDRPPVGGDEVLEGRDPRGQKAGLRRLGHCADHAGQRPAGPCQKPRPGQACSTAIPIRNTPLNPSTTRPRRAVA